MNKKRNKPKEHLKLCSFPLQPEGADNSYAVSCVDYTFNSLEHKWSPTETIVEYFPNKTEAKKFIKKKKLDERPSL